MLLRPPELQRKVVQIGYVCITTKQPDNIHLILRHNSKSNPETNLNTKQHTVVSIQLNMVTCHTYTDK